MGKGKRLRNQGVDRRSAPKVDPLDRLMSGQPAPEGERTIARLYDDWEKYGDPKDRARLDEYEAFMGHAD